MMRFLPKQYSQREICPGKDTTSNHGTSRRKFLSQVGAALAGGAVLGKAASASAQSYNSAIGDGIPSLRATDPRVKQSFAIRNAAATTEALIPVPPHTTNGDEQLYSDKSGTYSKGILQDGDRLGESACLSDLSATRINTGTIRRF